MSTIKDSKIVKKLLNFPGMFSTYHFIWAWMGAKIHHYPSQKIFVIGVTGTKGKTTTLGLINAILEAAGKRTALLSSVRVKIGDQDEKNMMDNSMPGRGYLQKFLKQAIASKCGYALIEVTSQGVVAHRHLFVDWNIGVLTNLAPEHIESHGSFENYRKAKLDFLKYVLKKGGKVFLNRDDANFPFFADALAEGKTAEYSKTDAWLRDYLPKLTPMHAMYGDHGAERKFLIKGFNEENIAVAVAIAKDLGIGDRVIEGAIAGFEGVPGRMEFVRADGLVAVVDYAHTPDSLEAAYKALGQELGVRSEGGRLICILGSVGATGDKRTGRDSWKRPEMGKIAAHYCDEIILTNEDPYNEDPGKVLDDIEAGITGVPYPRPGVLKILDRREAIQKAVDMMQQGDIVIGTGKGSEAWMHLAKGKKIPWDERQVMEEALIAKKNRLASNGG
jgi:UDP-N-acetylmuramoyl-L-alanyl-D-glutamate--2,6-diaminopimelate ligase